MMGQGVYEQYGVNDLEYNLRHVPSQRKGQTVAQKRKSKLWCNNRRKGA